MLKRAHRLPIGRPERPETAPCDRRVCAGCRRSTERRYAREFRPTHRRVSGAISIQVPRRDSPTPQSPIPRNRGSWATRSALKRRHRRLAARTYGKKCSSCVWGCHMPVEMIIDQWNPSVRRYRTETFSYGPKSCRFYAAGPKRVVPGRKGMRWVEEDWVDGKAILWVSPSAPGSSARLLGASRADQSHAPSRWNRHAEEDWSRGRPSPSVP